MPNLPYVFDEEQVREDLSRTLYLIIKSEMKLRPFEIPFN